MVKTYSLKADGNKALSAHFKVREFACPGTDTILIDEALPGLLERLYQAVQGVRAQVSRGHIEYRVHTGGRWLPWVRDRADYAGLYGKNADGVQMRLADLPGYAVEYRVAAVGREYYPWVRNYGDGANGYAGCFGQAFDRLQCRVVKE